MPRSMSTTRDALCVLALLSLVPGCAVEMASPDDVAALESAVRASDCYPHGNRYNCRPPAEGRAGSPRVYNPYTRSERWPVASGTPLMDGHGNVRGRVAGADVKINYGPRKRLHGQTLVYAFAARLDTGITASGWIPERALRHRRTLRRRMRTLRLPNPGRGHYRTRWVVTGGDNARYDGLKVTRGHRGGGHNATDYLMRPGDVVNIIYNTPGRGLGGFNVDTIRPGTIFRRARGVSQIRVPLYRPGGARAVSALHFVYGYIHDGAQRRYGWMAKQALAPAPETSPSAESGQCYARCCDGSLAGPLGAESGRACVSASSAACEGHGYVRRARFDEALVYQRDRSCWAKCRSRERYHRLDGVDEGCSLRAAAFCAEGDRGGLQDAMWSACAPG